MLTDDNEQITNTHEWCENPDDSQISLLQNIPFSAFGYYRDELLKFNTISICTIADLPVSAEGERKWIKENGFRSLLFVPVINQNNLIGTIGFYSEVGKQVNWKDDFTTMLGNIGNIIINVLERGKTEKALFDSESKFRQIVERSNEVLYRQRLEDMRFEYVSPRIIDFLGFTQDEMKEFSFDQQANRIHPDDLPILENFTNELIIADKEGSDFLEREFRMRHKLGYYIWVHGNYIISHDEDNKPQFIIGSLRDITERVKREEEIKVHEEELERIFDVSPDLIGLGTLEGNFTKVNKEFTKLLGYKADEIIDRPFIDFVHKDDLEITLKALGDALVGKEEIYIANRYITKKGLYIWIEWKVLAKPEENKFYTVGRDVTDRKRVEKELLESKFQLEKAQKLNQIGNWKLIPASGNVSGSSELFNVFDLKPEEASIESFVGVVHPDDREMDVAAIQRGIEHGESWDIEHRIICRNGKEKWVHAVGEAVCNENGSVVELVGTVQDITDRKKVEKKLLESEEKYRLITDTSIDSIYQLDVEGIITFMNPAGHKMFGYELGEMVGMSFGSLVNEERMEEGFKIVQTVLSGKSVEGETYVINKEKKEFPIRYHMSPKFNEANDVIGFTGNSRDITDFKKSEEELIKSNERFQVIAGSTPVSTVISRLSDGMLMYANQSFCEMLDYNIEDLIGNKSPELYYDKEGRENLMKEFSKNGKLSNFEVQVKKADGTPFWASVSLEPMIFEDDNALFGAVEDITDRKLNEEELNRSNERFRIIADATPVSTVISRISDGMMMYANQSFCKLFDYNFEDLIGKKSPEMYYEQKGRESLMKEFSKKGKLSNFELQVKKADGIPFWASVSVETMTFDGIDALFSTAVDITERKNSEQVLKDYKDNLEILVEKRTVQLKDKNKELEKSIKQLKITQQQLVDSEKMASLGQLTAGIAHEINNPVNYISAGSMSLESNLSEVLEFYKNFDQITPSNVNEKLKEIASLKEQIQYDELLRHVKNSINNIKSGVSKTSEIIKGLSTFSRSDNDEFVSADIHQGIDATLIMLHSKIPHGLTITKDYANIPIIECFPGKLNQVYTNLVVNAIDAVTEFRDPGEGKITIATSSIKIKKEKFVKITFSDNGSGIDEDKQKTIFDPFFTTKEVGKGTGLGLSICYGIVKQHNGWIEVNSSVGSGSMFEIFIPVHHNSDSNRILKK